MSFVSHESVHGLVQEDPLLYSLAEKMCDEPTGFDRYNYAKSVWLGNPDRTQRLAGEHPWPTRIRSGEEYVYSIPVLAGVDTEHQKLLYVGKDNWKEPEDPNAWLVAERGLLSGEEVERTVLTAYVDGSRRLRLHLAPLSYDNFPPILREAMRRKPAYDQIALTGYLNKEYSLGGSEIREGLDGRRLQFEDIEALESMIVMIQQLRIAERERSLFESAITLEQEFGTRSVALAYAV